MPVKDHQVLFPNGCSGVGYAVGIGKLNFIDARFPGFDNRPHLPAPQSLGREINGQRDYIKEVTFPRLPVLHHSRKLIARSQPYGYPV